MLNKTKIISTIGPSTNHPHLISKLIKNGMNVARLNMSHESSPEEIKTIIKSIRLEAKKLDKHIGIMMDISGPKIRVDLSNIGNEKVEITEGHVYTLGYSKMNDIPINMEIEFKDSMDSKAFVKIDDGNINFKIIKIKNNIIKLKALENGVILSNKGVNFPGLSLNIPPVTPKDKKDIKLGIKLEIDWFALSFVRSPNDIKPFLKCYKDNNVTIPVIAKIEKPEAIKNIDSIINATDAVMVARGDLGVEAPPQKVPVYQKMIVQKCIAKARPVVIATQMLESMTDNPTATRAEVNDVANSVIDGADAVMLSGETSVGKHPLKAVDTMRKIIRDIEGSEHNISKNTEEITIINGNRLLSNAICSNACSIAEQIKAKAIITITYSGFNTIKTSSFRPHAFIYAFTNNHTILNTLSLVWGVKGFYYDRGATTDQTIRETKEALKEEKYLKKGDLVVNLASMPVVVQMLGLFLKFHFLLMGLQIIIPFELVVL